MHALTQITILIKEAIDMHLFTLCPLSACRFHCLFCFVAAQKSNGISEYVTTLKLHSPPVNAFRVSYHKIASTQIHLVDGLVQDCSISSALAMEILQFCGKLSKYFFYICRNFMIRRRSKVDIFKLVDLSGRSRSTSSRIPSYWGIKV